MKRIALLLLIPMLSGCLGGEERSDWAYDMTQISDLNGDGLKGAGVRIAVLDTGINVDHPSLDHLVDGKKSNGELVGYFDTLENVKGLDHADDQNGHGSHVVGIMAARGSSTGGKLLNGGVNLLGATPASEYLVAKVCDDNGCSTNGIIDGVNWARNMNADIISLSLGGVPFIIDPENEAIKNAINGAIDQGIVVVAAAGNGGPDSNQQSNDVTSPSDIPYVIAVGAVNEKQKVSGISSRGNNGGANECRVAPVVGTQLGRCDPHKKPEVVAPGVSILSAWTGDSYAHATGTSQATPFVASVVALMLEGKPDLMNRNDVLLVKQALTATAKQIDGPGHSSASGYGIVQAKDALQAYEL